MGEYICSTELIAGAVRDYDGVKRKSEIGAMVSALKYDTSEVVASFGEDAALLVTNGQGLLLAADGIWSRLMDSDPYWAGYCAVLVNIHDIAAMGGRPIAMVDVLSAKAGNIRDRVIKGMSDASKQFGVPIVGGHLHPDATYSVIDIAILGIVEPDCVIFSSTAKKGDYVVVAIDLNGRVHPSCFLNWDTATLRTDKEVRDQIALLEILGKRHLISAGKDISNPGIIGTLGMLLEASKKGATIDLDSIPRPDLKQYKVTFDQWVRMYPGMGFVLTVPPDSYDEVVSLFAGVKMTATKIGTINESDKLKITYKEQSTMVFDFTHKGGITNI